MAAAARKRSPTPVLRRCHWVPADDPEYLRYHDEEWGRPVHGDRLLFEMLILEGAQAGLSWSTVLHKRRAYRRAFARFDPRKVARIDAPRSGGADARSGHRAQPPQDRVYGHQRAGLTSPCSASLAPLTATCGPSPGAHRASTGRAAGRSRRAPSSSDAISKDLLKRGFRFVGSTIIYAYLQAVGVVNDHTRECYLCPKAAPGDRRRLK